MLRQQHDHSHQILPAGCIVMETHSSPKDPHIHWQLPPVPNDPYENRTLEYEIPSVQTRFETLLFQPLSVVLMQTLEDHLYHYSQRCFHRQMVLYPPLRGPSPKTWNP